MRRLRLITLSALSTLAIAGSVSAQQLFPSPTAVPQGRETSIDVIGDILYNSNVAASSQAVAAARGLKLADEIFTPGVSAAIARPLGSQMLFLTGSAGYRFYAENTQLNRANIDLNAGTGGHIGVCEDTLIGGYRLQQSDLNQTQVNTTSNMVQIPVVSLTATCGRRIGFAPTASVSADWRINSADQLTPSNSRTFNATAGVAYRSPGIGVVSVYGQYGNSLFPNSEFLINGDLLTNGFQTFGGAIKYDRPIGARLELSASLGYTSLEQNLPNSRGFDGVTYSFDGTYRLGVRTTLHGRFARAALPSYQTNATFTVTELYELDAAYQASSRLEFSLRGSILDQTFEGAPLNAAIGLTQETISEIMGKATFTPSRHLSLTLNTGWQQRDANETGLSYSAFLIGLEAKSPF